VEDEDLLFVVLGAAALPAIPAPAPRAPQSATARPALMAVECVMEMLLLSVGTCGSQHRAGV
jgi:hypothetical protein